MAEMRELHVYDCALMGAFPMRLILATMLVAGRLLATLMAAPSAQAEPETCPPICDQIPATAWISTHAVPLNSQYRWPAMAGAAVAVTRATPRFGFEQVCATPAFPHDSRDWAVAGRVTVVHPDGQWQLQAQVLHWRGDTRPRWPDRGVGVWHRRRRVTRLPAGRTAAVAVGHRRRTDPDGRGDQRAGHHAHLPGRARIKQHDQRTHLVVVRAATSSVAYGCGLRGSGRPDRAVMRSLHRLVPVTRRGTCRR